VGRWDGICKRLPLVASGFFFFVVVGLENRVGRVDEGLPLLIPDCKRARLLRSENGVWPSFVDSG